MPIPRNFAGVWKGRPPARRDMRISDPRRSLRLFLPALLTLIGLHVLAMVAFEGMAVGDALWLTLTTVTTVGFGDVVAKTLPGRMATVLLLFCGGIWLAFQIATVGFEYRLDRRQRMRCGTWRWRMRDHILVLNIPAEHVVPYVTRLVCELRSSEPFRDRPVQLLTSGHAGGLPPELTDMGVVHYSGESWDPEALRAVDVDKAAFIVVMAAEEGNPASDGHTFDTVDRLRSCGAGGTILCECVDDKNRDRLKRIGADILVRPMRGYPEMIVRALAAPGAEAILEDLFNSRGEECWRYAVGVDGLRWADIVRALLEADIGLAIAFRHAGDRTVAINPHPDTTVVADKLFVLVREGNDRPEAEVAAILRRDCRPARVA